MLDQGPDSNTKLATSFLAVLGVITAIVSAVLRLLAPGWMILLFGIPLLIAAVVHIIVHVRAATRPAEQLGSPVWLFFLSDLLCLLGFGLQPDASDAPGFYFGLYNAWHLLTSGGRTDFPLIDLTNSWNLPFFASIACLIGLVVTWAIIWAQSGAPKNESTVGTA